MLAAVPERGNSSLELIRLVLSMIAENGQAIPPQLKALIVNVIGEAKTLAQDPKRRGPIQHTESILLALEMRHEAGLASTMGEVTNFESIRPELATRMLSFMEHHPA